MSSFLITCGKKLDLQFKPVKHKFGCISAALINTFHNYTVDVQLKLGFYLGGCVCVGGDTLGMQHQELTFIIIKTK